MEQLKRAVRFLLGAPRLGHRLWMQQLPNKLIAFSDSDHAGCLKTRKSTSGSMVFFGKHMVKSTSSTQGVIALSSGESEFYAAVKSASIGLGLLSMLKDMGIVITEALDERLDATVGIGIASRRGAGRIRHIHTPTLWLQRAVNDGRVAISKVAGWH